MRLIKTTNLHICLYHFNHKDKKEKKNMENFIPFLPSPMRWNMKRHWKGHVTCDITTIKLWQKNIQYGKNKCVCRSVLWHKQAKHFKTFFFYSVLCFCTNMTNQSSHSKRNIEKFLSFLNGSYRYSFRINSSSEEGGLPRVDIFLTLTGQLQLTVIFIHVSVNIK